MNVRPLRSKRRSATPATPADGGDLTGAEAEEAAPQAIQSGSRKRRKSSEPSQGAAADEGFPANGSGRATATPGAMPSQQLPRVRINQQDTVTLDEQVEKYKAAAQVALDKAEDLGVPRQNVDNLVAKVVRLMLFKSFEKPDAPVKREELIKEIQKDQKGGRGAKQLPGLVLPIAAGKLATTFGMEMLELKRGAAQPRPTSAAAAGEGASSSGGGTQTYVLRSLLPSVLMQRFVQDPAEDAMRGLMTTIVALLELAPDKKLDSDDLWRHLGQLGVEEDPADHDRLEQACVFGRDRALGVLAHMEKARYIVKKLESQQAGGGGQVTKYELAEAAYEPQFHAGVKAMLDKWLGPAPTGAAANADGGS